MLPCELDSAVEGVDVFNEGIQDATVPSPNEEFIFYVSLLNPGMAWSLIERAFFKVTHDEASKGRSHADAHGSTMYLKIVLSKKGGRILDQH